MLNKKTTPPSSPSMAEYAHYHCNIYISDKYASEQLLIENPIPLNLQ